jgi:Xaa-Pro dipeptidase
MKSAADQPDLSGKMARPADLSSPEYSTAERDRRWAAVRENAANLGLDAVFVPLGNTEDARYLTQMTGASVVLPTDAARPPLVITDRGAGNSWIADSRPANRAWATPMAEALLDAGLGHGRIGVSGLKNGRVTHVRAYDGVLNYSAYAEVLRRLPNATFIDATDVIGMARYVKSEEEIASARYASQIAGAGIEELIEIARPGVDEAFLYARVCARMMELGSENYHWAIKTGSLEDEGPRFTSPPIGRRLKVGAYITDEVDAVWGGIVAQEDQPILLGPIPEAWKPIINLQGDAFRAGLQAIRPGVTFGDLIDSTNSFGETRGGATRITLSGRGYGQDGPLLTSRSAGDAVRSMEIREGNVFVWKPSALSTDGQRSFSWGGTIVVRAQGAQMLVSREPGLVSITS